MFKRNKDNSDKYHWIIGKFNQISLLLSLLPSILGLYQECFDRKSSKLVYLKLSRCNFKMSPKSQCYQFWKKIKLKLDLK